VDSPASHILGNGLYIHSGYGMIKQGFPLDTVAPEHFPLSLSSSMRPRKPVEQVSVGNLSNLFPGSRDFLGRFGIFLTSFLRRTTRRTMGYVTFA